MVEAGAGARIFIVGLAPGARVHVSGVPWSDLIGKRLRARMDIDANTFYDEQKMAIVPMGFCYPGRAASGDLPLRPKCAPLWHARLLAQLPLVVVQGQFVVRRRPAAGAAKPRWPPRRRTRMLTAGRLC